MRKDPRHAYKMVLTVQNKMESRENPSHYLRPIHGQKAYVSAT